MNKVMSSILMVLAIVLIVFVMSAQAHALTAVTKMTVHSNVNGTVVVIDKDGNLYTFVFPKPQRDLVKGKKVSIRLFLRFNENSNPQSFIIENMEIL